MNKNVHLRGEYTQRHVTIRYRNFKKFNQENFLANLKEENFNDIYEISDPDEALDFWCSKFNRDLDQHAPIVHKRVKRKNQPKWHCDELAELRYTRDFYHQRKDFVNYKLFRNKLTSKLRACKSEYFTKAVESGNSTSELWKHLTNMKSETKHQISRIISNGSEVNDPEEICEKFNTHFSIVAKSFVENPKLFIHKNCKIL